jgi:hypothetical protein
MPGQNQDVAKPIGALRPGMPALWRRISRPAPELGSVLCHRIAAEFARFGVK